MPIDNDIFETFLDNMDIGYAIVDRNCLIIKKNENFYKDPDLIDNGKINHKKIVDVINGILDRKSNFYTEKLEEFNVVILPKKLEDNTFHFYIILFNKKIYSRSIVELQQNDSGFRSIVERNFDTIYILNRDGLITYVSPAVEKAFTVRQSEIEKRNFIDFVKEDYIKDAVSYFKRVLSGDEVSNVELELVNHGKKIFYVELNMSPIWEGKDIVGIQGIARNITKRKIIENELAQEKDKLSVILNSLGEGVIATDIKGSITFINNKAVKIVGYKHKQYIGMFVKDIFFAEGHQSTDDYKKKFYDYHLSDKLNNIVRQQKIILPDGTEKIISAKVSKICYRKNDVIGYVMVVRDITEQIKINDELLRIKRLESLSNIAAGIAHDYNNILTAIMGSLSMAKGRIGTDELTVKLLNTAEEAAQRAKDLTLDLLNYSKGGSVVKTKTGITELIKDAAEFVVRNSDITCVFSFSADLSMLHIDPEQFSRVIQNMVINADHSMPDGGEIYISAEEVQLTDNALPIANGKYVLIKIKDSGSGIPQNQLEHIFDPFYSKNTGSSKIGLANSFTIIRRHDGYITVDSKIKEGTVFSIYLPVIE